MASKILKSNRARQAKGRIGTAPDSQMKSCWTDGQIINRPVTDQEYRRKHWEFINPRMEKKAQSLSTKFIDNNGGEHKVDNKNSKQLVLF